MHISRKEFLQGLGLLGASAMLGGSKLARAQSGSDYRALVCVFLFGGNDGNNMIVPLDSAGYSAYATARQPSANGGLALAQGSLLPLAPASGPAQFGLHPDLRDLQGLWSSGNLAAVFNVGTLIRPVTKAQVVSQSAALPRSLLSHQDQQYQWQSAISDDFARTGWGGRIADATPVEKLPTVISLSGNTLFGTGETSSFLSVPSASNAFFGLSGFDGTSAAAAKQSAMQAIRSFVFGDSLSQATAGTYNQALDASAALAPVLRGAGSSVDSLFAPLGSPFSLQLQQVARMIQARAELGMNRQIFFVSLGGFDTHVDQLARQSALFKQLGSGLSAFYKATEQLGVAKQVTAFTLSDFGRTLAPNSGRGSDHGWGNHQLVVGGSVVGQQTYGTFPTLALGGPDDFTAQGRWVPTTSVDQYAATLASWYGVPADQLPRVLPNVAQFSSSNLGLLTPVGR